MNYDHEDALYLYFSKAFESIPLFLQKMKIYGFNGDLL